MRMLFVMVASLLIALPLVGQKQPKMQHIDFKRVDISGTTSKPMGSTIDARLTKVTQTEVKVREDFKPELSASLDEL